MLKRTLRFDARRPIFWGFTLFALMTPLKAQDRREKLPVDDGKRGVAALPLDKETSSRAFQTATFGLG